MLGAVYKVLEGQSGVTVKHNIIAVMIEFVVCCCQDTIAQRLLELVSFLAERNEALPTDAYVRLASHRNNGNWAREFITNFARPQVMAYRGWATPQMFFVAVVQEMSADDATGLLERACEYHPLQNYYEW
jgi:hypothetical protein